jgi:hypothetical protein
VEIEVNGDGGGSSWVEIEGLSFLSIRESTPDPISGMHGQSWIQFISDMCKYVVRNTTRQSKSVDWQSASYEQGLEKEVSLATKSALAVDIHWQDLLTVWVERDNVLHREMETFNSLMLVTMDEGDISEYSNNWHDGPIGWHRELVLGLIVGGVRNNTKKGGWRSKYVDSATILCVLVRRHVHIHIDGECFFVRIGVEYKARDM